jgi:hypothetical protein
LKQLEKERELPPGMKLIQPMAAFCLKTYVKNKKNPKAKTKFFVNCCMSPELERPGQKNSDKGA